MVHQHVNPGNQLRLSLKLGSLHLCQSPEKFEASGQWGLEPANRANARRHTDSIP